MLEGNVFIKWNKIQVIHSHIKYINGRARAHPNIHRDRLGQFVLSNILRLMDRNVSE